MSRSIEDVVKSVKAGEIKGNDLAEMVVRGEISKSDRRKVVKLSGKQSKSEKSEVSELTSRQKLRLEVKEKKSLPKLSKEERRHKFIGSLVEKKELERQKDAANFTTCLGCRKRGHFLKDCPRVVLPIAQATDEPVVNICFNCGETGHALRHCSKSRRKDGVLPYATCFICKRKGHISKDCDENPNGLYPKGGCCHICLQKTHLVRDCPERTEEDKLLHSERRKRLAQETEDIEQGPRIGAIISDVLRGGDDLDIYPLANDANDSDEENGKIEGGKKVKKRKRT